MFDIVLYQPEIPQNTGNIIRLCANTGAHLKIIRPLGFTWDNKRLKRAGLDYHASANVELIDSFEDFKKIHTPRRLSALSTKGKRSYAEPNFTPGDAFIFGPETRGLPESYLTPPFITECLTIPMIEGSRSLNLANSVAIMLYEALRQQSFSFS